MSGPGVRNDDYYCSLIYLEIESRPAKESDLIRRLKRQNVSAEDVKKCLQLMETNGSIRKTRRSTASDPFWQLVSELQSLDYQEEDAEPSSGSFNDLCESVENCSLNSSRSNDRTEPKSSIGRESLPPPAIRSRSMGDNSSRSDQTTPKTAPPSGSEHSVGTNSLVSSVPGNPSSLSRSIDLEENKSMSSETPSASQSVSYSRCLFTQTTNEESDRSSRVERRYISQTQTGSNTQTISAGQINIETSAPVNHYQKDEIDPKLKPTVEDLQKILKLLNKESSKDIKPLDVAKLTGIGSNKKDVNRLLHFLEKKNLLTLKTGEKGANPRWSRHPTNIYTETNLQEWAAELVYKSTPKLEATTVHHHHHNHQHNNYVQVGDQNRMELPQSNQQGEQTRRENEVEGRSEDLVSSIQTPSP